MEPTTKPPIKESHTPRFRYLYKKILKQTAPIPYTILKGPIMVHVRDSIYPFFNRQNNISIMTPAKEPIINKSKIL